MCGDTERLTGPNYTFPEIQYLCKQRGITKTYVVYQQIMKACVKSWIIIEVWPLFHSRKLIPTREMKKFLPAGF